MAGDSADFRRSFPHYSRRGWVRTGRADRRVRAALAGSGHAPRSRTCRTGGQYLRTIRPDAGSRGQRLQAAGRHAPDVLIAWREAVAADPVANPLRRDDDEHLIVRISSAIRAGKLPQFSRQRARTGNQDAGEHILRRQCAASVVAKPAHIASDDTHTTPSRRRPRVRPPLYAPERGKLSTGKPERVTRRSWIQPARRRWRPRSPTADRRP